MTEPVSLVETVINQKWTLFLPEHRSLRPEWTSGWEAERLDSMHHNIGPGDVVYDIGSEEGDLSALYQTWIGSGDGGVCLFEPNAKVWPNIKAIWGGNYLKTPLGFWSGFAGFEDRLLGKEKVFDWPESADGPLIADHGFCNIDERPDIPCVRLDLFRELTTAAPSVITVDVEGAELFVFWGATEILTTQKPLLYVSIHPEFMKRYDHKAQELHQLLSDYGYREKWLATDHEEHWVFWHPFGKELRF